MAANTARKQRGKPFAKGQSGNPAGKPVGTRNAATVAAEALLDGEAEELTRTAIDKAKAGDVQALRICMDRLLPPRRDRPLAFRLPAMKAISDLAPAIASIAGAVANGEVTLAEAAELSKIVASFGEAVKTLDLEDRLSALEKVQEAKR